MRLTLTPTQEPTGAASARLTTHCLSLSSAREVVGKQKTSLWEEAPLQIAQRLPQLVFRDFFAIALTPELKGAVEHERMLPASIWRLRGCLWCTLLGASALGGCRGCTKCWGRSFTRLLCCLDARLLSCLDARLLSCLGILHIVARETGSSMRCK